MDYQLKSVYNSEHAHWDVTVKGEVDIYNSQELKAALTALLDQHQSNIYIHCDNLEYIDSTALGALVGVLKNVKSFGGEIHIINMRPSLAKIFRITDLDKVFKIEGEKND